MPRPPLIPRQTALAQLQAVAAASPTVQRLQDLRATTFGTVQRVSEDGATQGQLPRAEGPGRLPASLRAGIERLSGLAMDDVRVHRNSGAPARYDAHAYAQGEDIHLAPGQDHHLPHEAWHIVQQAQGRVAPTTVAHGVGINDDPGLEREADLMGARAAAETSDEGAALQARAKPSGTIQRITLYHGTTQENAERIADRGIDPEMGGGEFGMGFYTTFGQAQARHIAKYYWDKEKKYDTKSKGIAVVKITIPDAWWKELMASADESRRVVHKTNDLWFNSFGSPLDEAKGGETLDLDDTELKPREDGLDWMPRRTAPFEYHDQKDEDLENSIAIGKIKDPQTPYMQIVLGRDFEDILDRKDVEIEVIGEQDQGGAFGAPGYAADKAAGVDEIGSFAMTDAVRNRVFIEEARGPTKRADRLALLQRTVGLNGENLDTTGASFLEKSGLDGDNDGDRLYSYYDKGLPAL